MKPPAPSDWETLRRLAHLLKPHSPAIGIALASLTAASAGLLAIPLVVNDMLERANAAPPSPPSGLQIATMAAALGLLAVAAYVSAVLLHEVARKVCARLRIDYVTRWLRASMGSHRDMAPGEWAERLNTCLTDIDWFIKSSLGNFLGVLLLISGGVFMLFWMNWRLAVITILVCPVAVGALKFIERETRQLLRQSRAEGEKMAGALQSVILGLDVIKAFNAEDRELGRFRDRQQRLMDLQRRESYISSLVEPVFIATGAITAMFVVFFAGRFIAEGTMSAAELVTFLVYLMFILPNLRTLGLQLARWRHVKVALEFLDDASRLQAEADAPGAEVLSPPLHGRIEFRNVTYAHEGRSRGLDDVSFEIRPGETVGLVGASGAGKSTILNLLLRFYSPTGGSILIDGREVSRCTRVSVREAVSFVPQEGILFDGTIRDNVAIGRPGACDEEVRRACEAAQAWSFITDLPDGLDTHTGDRGLKLSAGQRQRLTIARAFLKEAPILLLDEATSALDAGTELLFGEALRGVLRGRTTIVVAHRLGTIAGLPRVLFLHGGKIADEGTHAELMARNGAYRSVTGSIGH
ncbi:MAG: ABC transporter ATP-binding protein [Chthoniobacterales bacterium]|nr:ABC transporter ATP-binding protein [Chthoniobacterales bacterium]